MEIGSTIADAETGNEWIALSPSVSFGFRSTFLMQLNETRLSGTGRCLTKRRRAEWNRTARDTFDCITVDIIQRAQTRIWRGSGRIFRQRMSFRVIAAAVSRFKPRPCYFGLVIIPISSRNGRKFNENSVLSVVAEAARPRANLINSSLLAASRDTIFSLSCKHAVHPCSKTYPI